MKGWAIFIVVVIILLIISIGAFALYVRQRNQRLASSNYPAPAPGGVVGWVNDKIAALKRGRFTSGTGYETARGGEAARRARALDPDEAWDANVGQEAYYEEQELGLHQPTAYSGAGYGRRSPGLAAGGAGGERELDRGYDEEAAAGGGAGRNPFGDDNAGSMRSVSPRPLDVGAAQKAKGGQSGSAESSPTAERRSVFREEM